MAAWLLPLVVVINSKLILWDPRTGKLQQRLAGGGGAVFAVGISADGKKIVWGQQDACPNERSCPQKLGDLEYQLLIAPSLGSPSKLGQANVSWQRASS